MTSRKEKKILEEIQRRVFEEDEKLAQKKELESLNEATFEVLKENTSLSSKQIEKIAKEVKKEINKKQKVLIYSAISVLTIAFVIFLVFFFSKTGSEEVVSRKQVEKVIKKPVKKVVKAKPVKKVVSKKIVKPKSIDKNKLKITLEKVKKINSIINITNKHIVNINKSVNRLGDYNEAVKRAKKRKRIKFRRPYDCAFDFDQSSFNNGVKALKSGGVNSSNIESMANQYSGVVKK